MIQLAVTTQIFCMIFASAGPPDFYLTQSRKALACKVSPQIIEDSKANELEPTLILALITVESGWNKSVVSHAGACGLTQVVPRYTGKITRKYKCNELKQPKHSIRAGTKILRWWINHHKGDIARGLCAYNAGYRCGGKKPNRSGMRYARKVLKYKNIFDQKVAGTVD